MQISHITFHHMAVCNFYHILSTQPPRVPCCAGACLYMFSVVSHTSKVLCVDINMYKGSLYAVLALALQWAA